MSKLNKGIYRHYKDGEYEIIDEALNSDDKVKMVVYKETKDGGKIWVRSKEEFLSEVEVDGKKVKRFEFVKEQEEDEYKVMYLRALADYQNLSRQTLKEKADFAKFAIEDFLQEILPVYDHLKLSLKGLKDEERSNAWVEGVRYVLNQFKTVLESKGVEEIKTEGEKFNHDEMEALEGDGENVQKEVMPGYKLNGRVIRPAKVIVA